MNKHDALRVNNETIETTYALLNQLEQLLDDEAFHFRRQMRAIIKVIRGILWYENSDWKIEERFKSLTTIIEGILALIPLDYNGSERAAVANYLNAADNFDCEVRSLVADQYGLRKMKKRALPMWEI